MALGDVNPALLTDAEQCFRLFWSSEKASPALYEMVVYRLASA